MNKQEQDAHMITLMGQGFISTYLLYTVCKLGILDVIASGKNTAYELSKEKKTETAVIERFLRALAAYDFIKKEQGERYVLTQKGELLTQKAENSLKSYIMYCGGICAKSWSVMAEAVEKGEVPYRLAVGDSLFAGNEASKENYQAFNGMMDYVSRGMELAQYVREQDIAVNSRIVDVGGGTGAVILQFLECMKEASGTIVDLEFVKEKAFDNIKAHKLQDRCTFVTGDFFHPLAVQGDVFLLSRVLHDWGRQESIQILKNIKAAMGEQSVLYIMELVIPEKEGRENLGIYLNDLQIWAVCGGTERSLQEYQQLLEEAGLSYIGATQIPSGEFVIEAR